MKRQLFAHSCSTRRSDASGRQGIVLVAVLVCLLVVMGILGSMLKGTLLAHRQLHTERDLRQTELLLEAGRDRARCRLTNETNYRGETWNLPADTISGQGVGRVTIEISPTEGQAARTAQIFAEYPLGGERSIRRSHTFRLLTQKPREQE